MRPCEDTREGRNWVQEQGLVKQGLEAFIASIYYQSSLQTRKASREGLDALHKTFQRLRGLKTRC